MSVFFDKTCITAGEDEEDVSNNAFASCPFTLILLSKMSLEHIATTHPDVECDLINHYL
jgi:hypothetical protein